MSRGETTFRELARYVRFDQHDVARLRGFHGVAAGQFTRIAQDFYDRTREHEAAHAVFSGEEQIARLQRSLVQWLHRLCTAERDEAYFEETAKIGSVHVKVGLPQRYMFTAMALIRVELDRIVEESGMPDGALMRATLAKALDLELAIMLETYHDAFVERLSRIEHLEREDLGRALARSEHRYVNAVELAPYLVVGLDAHSTIQLFNREAERVSGYARDELIGASFVESLLAGELGAGQAPFVTPALEGEGEGGRPFESAVRTRSGKVRVVRWQIAHAPPLPAGTHAPLDEVIAFAIGQDVTDEKALAERTRQTEKLAAVGTLAAGLAHEIRNPLNGAHLHLTFLARGLVKSGAGQDLLEAVKVVADEITRLSALVSEFLDFARPKGLEKSAVSVQALAERACHLVAADAERAHVVIATELPAAELLVDGDSAKLEQVLLNLLANAIEVLAPIGGGHVRLRARRQPLIAVIEVEDDGPGIPSPPAPIFDAFYSTKATGTGLGLAIVHRIVGDHGGAIDVDSKPGRTVFRVTLPIASNVG